MRYKAGAPALRPGADATPSTHDSTPMRLTPKGPTEAAHPCEYIEGEPTQHQILLHSTKDYCMFPKWRLFSRHETVQAVQDESSLSFT